MSVNPDYQREADYFNKLAARHHIAVSKSPSSASSLGGSDSRYTPLYPSSGYGYGGASAFSSSSSSSSVYVGGAGSADLGTMRALQNDRRNGNAAVIFGLGLIALGALFAYVTKDYSEKSANLEEAQEFKKYLKRLPKESEDLATKKEIVGAEIKFAEKALSKSRQIVVVTASLLATAAIGFTAGMLGVSWLVTASIIVGVFTLAIGAFLGVRHYIDKPNALPDYATRNLAELLANNTQYQQAV